LEERRALLSAIVPDNISVFPTEALDPHPTSLEGNDCGISASLRSAGTVDLKTIYVPTPAMETVSVGWTLSKQAFTAHL
jgi:hypothetical protein